MWSAVEYIQSKLSSNAHSSSVLVATMMSRKSVQLFSVALQLLLIVINIECCKSRTPSFQIISVHAFMTRPSYFSEADYEQRVRLVASNDDVHIQRPNFVPLCLDPRDIYDPIAKVCSRPYTSAHCGDNMSFQFVPDSMDLGACLCDNFLCLGRPNILAASRNRCYGIATQGPCNDGETLIPISKLHAECGLDACLNNPPENAINFSEGSKPDNIFGKDVDGKGTLTYPFFPVFNFTYMGKCYSTESQAFCRSGQVARFILPDKIPTCVDRNEDDCVKRYMTHILARGRMMLGFVATSECKYGTVANPTRRFCQPESGFDFD